MPSARLLHLLIRLQIVCTADERVANARVGLQTVHASILDFLQRANRYSDTPIAVSEYLGITKGTVSQSILWLRRHRWLVAQKDLQDRRKLHLRLSAKASKHLAKISKMSVLGKLLAQDPLLIQRCEKELADLLTAAQRHSHKSFGVCHSCRHLQRLSANQSRCGLTGEPLTPADTEKICREHATS